MQIPNITITCQGKIMGDKNESPINENFTSSETEDDHMLSPAMSEAINSQNTPPGQICIAYATESAGVKCSYKKKFFSLMKFRSLLKTRNTKSCSDLSRPKTNVDRTKIRASDSKVDRISQDELTRDAQVRFKLGVASMSAGNVDKAKFNFTKSLEARLLLHGPDHTDVALAHEKLGDIAAIRNQFDKVHLHYDTAIPIIRTCRDVNIKKLVIAIYIKKGKSIMKNNEKDIALECFAQAVSLMHHSIENYQEDLKRTLIEMGHLFVEKGDSRKALKCFSEALTYDSVAEEHFVWYMTSLISFCQGEYEKALTYFERVLKIKKEMLGDKHKDVATVLRYIGYILFNTGNFDDALECFEEAMLVMKESTFELEKGLAVCAYIEEIYSRRGVSTEIIECYKNLLSMAKIEPSQHHDEVENILHKLGDIHLSLDDDNGAIQGTMTEGKAGNRNEDNASTITRRLCKNEFQDFDAAELNKLKEEAWKMIEKIEKGTPGDL